jgi:hypothetical protein
VTEDWQSRAEGLADKLTADGDVHTAEWRSAVCAVPRHELVPRYYEPEGTSYRLVEPDDDASRRVWLDLVYSDTTLITRRWTARPKRPGRYRVRHAGPHDLWADVEDAHDEWARMGAPAWHRFGLTATPTTQRVWLDSPDSPHTWNLHT